MQPRSDDLEDKLLADHLLFLCKCLLHGRFCVLQMSQRLKADVPAINAADDVFGLTPAFLESLNVTLPLVKEIFVINVSKTIRIIVTV